MTQKTVPVTPEVPDDFYKTESQRSLWHPEYLHALRVVLDDGPVSGVALVSSYRHLANDANRSVGAIYAQVCELVRDGARISGPVSQQLHRLMCHERDLRRAAKPKKESNLTRALDSVAAQKEHDAKLPDAVAEDANTILLRAFVKTWRAGNMSDAELLTALRSLSL